ncbi:MAG: hypothetical protein Q9195_005527 [Heterodermia aff. obscurata]
MPSRPFRAPYMIDASERTLYTFHPDRLYNVSMLDDLMLRFPRLTIEDISDGNHERSCGICQTEYQGTYGEARGCAEVDKGEQPVQLSCGHVFGHDCLSRWLPKNNCPVCRVGLLEGHVNRYGKLKVRLGKAALLRDLEVADHLMSALHGHPHPNIDPNRDTYDFFQGPSTETALIREIADARTRTENRNRIRLDNENRLFHRRREYQLFQQLQAEGVELPRSLTLDSIVEGYLEARQEQALFEYLQQRGAFRYPNMDKFFRREPALSDREMYEKLRLLGCLWQPYGTWERADGIMIFLSVELWEQLDRRRREPNGDDVLQTELRRLGPFPLGIDDVLDDNIDLDDGAQDADELDDAEQRQGLTRRISVSGLVRRAFRSVVPRHRFRRSGRGVHWRLSSILYRNSQSSLEEDDIDEVVRNNGTWEVDLDLTE